MRYVICGFSGAGKSYSLDKIKQSGRYSDFEFIDLDTYIENEVGQSICVFVEENSEKKFREIELEALKKVLKLSNNMWISLGGGTLGPEAKVYLKGLKNLKLFHLQTSFEICWDRIAHDSSRFLTKNGKKEMQNLYKERMKILADIEPFGLEQHI